MEIKTTLDNLLFNYGLVIPYESEGITIKNQFICGNLDTTKGPPKLFLCIETVYLKKTSVFFGTELSHLLVTTRHHHCSPNNNNCLPMANYRFTFIYS